MTRVNGTEVAHSRKKNPFCRNGCFVVGRNDFADRKEAKKFYDDSVLQGVRLHFAKNISTEIRESCKDFCRWLRRNYFFPIRCNIIIKNCSYFERDKGIAGDKDSYADFYYDSGEKEDCPEI